MSTNTANQIDLNEFLLTSVKTVFENWTALQLAVTHRFGGSKTKETYEWFLNATYEWIRDNSDLEDYELEDFLENTMNQEFNTILDDNSPFELSKILINYNHLLRSGKINEITDDINRRFAKKSASSTVSSSIKFKNQEQIDDDTSSSEEDGEEEINNNDENGEDMNVDMEKSAEKNEMNEEEKNNFEMVEEGWTYVAKSGKHFTK